ncbi:MAG: DMT family transporter [Lachnospiraceae bacterium]|nr:DMT family transporter [Lachnospiraceae bacterium]
MKYLEKHPMIMIIIGIMGISMSAIFVRYSDAPSVVTASYRLLWTVLLMTPVVLVQKQFRTELRAVSGKTIGFCFVSGFFLAIHFSVWFESLRFTSVASSTTIVCTEVIWVSIGFCLFMKGKLSGKAVATIAVTFLGSVLIAFSDSGTGGNLYGDILSLLAAIAVAVYTLIGRQVRANTSTTVYTYLVYIASAITLVIITVMQGESLMIQEAGDYKAVIVGLLLSVFSTILGHSIFSWCLKFFSPSFVSASKLCEPVVAAILAIFLFGEIPGLLQILGGAVILGGVYAYSKIEQKEHM